MSNVACVPLRSCFSSNSPGYTHLKDCENSPSSFIAQRSSVNRLVAWYLYALFDFFRNKILSILRLKKIEKQICPEMSRINTYKDSNTLFEHHISDSKITNID